MTVVAGVAVAFVGGAIALLVPAPMTAPPVVAPEVSVDSPPAPEPAKLNHENAQRLLERGRELMKARDFRQAEPTLLECLELEPGHAECHLALGDVYARRRDPERSREHHREFLRLAPNHERAAEIQQLLSGARDAGVLPVRPAGATLKAPSIRTVDGGVDVRPLVAPNRISSWGDGGTSDAGVVAVVARKVAGDLPLRADGGNAPKDVPLTEAQKLYAGGRSLYKAQQFTEALVLFNMCLESDKNNPDCHRALGATYAKLGGPEEGARHYREFLRLAPNHKQAPEVRKLLEEYESQRAGE